MNERALGTGRSALAGVLVRALRPDNPLARAERPAPPVRRFVLATVLIAFAGVTNAADLDLSYCATCHGGQGNGNPAIRAPKIAGMEQWYLKRQLESFRAGMRGTNPEDAAGNEMRPMAAHLSDDAKLTQALMHVAKWQPAAPPITVTGNSTRGKELYATCASCHGDRGEGNVQMNAPALAERTDWYLVTQLKNFMAGLRGFDSRDTFGVQMRAASATLPDAQATADVVAYINTLR
jgi:cytochrome c553